MRVFIFFLFMCCYCFSANASQEEKCISVATYGAIPDDGKDDTEALRRAVEYCRKHVGVTLKIPSGVYCLRDSRAIQLEEDVLSGKMGNDPEKTIFTPYYPYVRGLDFSGSDSLVVDAQGAVLLCEGWMEPISLNDCHNVTIKGLTIDYKRKPLSQGIIQQVKEESFTVKFDDRREITENIPITRMTIWDDECDGFYGSAFYFPERKLLGNNLVEFKAQIPARLQGAKLAALHSFHFRPAILIQNSKQITLDGVTIHSQPGMGIVGFDSSDIFLYHLSVTPAPGYQFSTNTDATHFACCRGVIRFDGCFFHGQGDDATNVHGYYHSIKELKDGYATLKLEAPTFTHAQVTDVPQVGDKMELVRISTLVPEGEYEVLDVKHAGKSVEVRVRLNGDIPSNIHDYYLFNVSKLPRLEFVRNVVWGQMARGVLVKTRGVLIEGNVFRGCSGSAIHVGAESYWKEGTFSKDVTIVSNVILNCGSSGGTFGASGIAVGIDAPDTELTKLHENMIIRDNTIITNQNNECGIAVYNARNVELSNNRIEGCQKEIVFHSVEGVTMK